MRTLAAAALLLAACAAPESLSPVPEGVGEAAAADGVGGAAPCPPVECRETFRAWDGSCSDHWPADAFTLCAGGICDGAGACVECISALDCGEPTDCDHPVCEQGTCSRRPAVAGNPCGIGGACDGAGHCN